jgi:uncharacterized protein
MSDFFAWDTRAPSAGTAELDVPAPRDDERSEPLIDADVHTRLPSNATLAKYLSPRWRRYYEQFGLRAPHLAAHLLRPRAAACREDSWPPAGGPPGSDPEFFREQLLDRWGISYALVNPLDVIRFAEEPAEYSAALTSALNDWALEEWLEPDDRLYGSICCAFEDGDLAAAEIERLGGHPRFKQILLNARTREPLGARRYWKLYEAAEAYDLPIAVHVGGLARNTITGAGWPSTYYEDHSGYPQAFHAHITSMVAEGVFERFPGLKLILEEGGFAWVPPLMWRFDRAWEQLRDEIPGVTQPPSHYIRKHFWFTTQPIEEPEHPEQFTQILEQLGMDDRIMFSSDYPHWDFDAPNQALPRTLTSEQRRAIRYANAAALYGFDGVGA